MGLRDYLLLLRRRWKLVVGSAAAVIGLTLLVNSALLPKEYTGTAQLLVGGGKKITPNQGAQVVSIGTLRVQSYAGLANSLDVARAAVRQGDLQVQPETLQGRISASVPTNSQLVDLAVTAPTANGAQRATNAVATALSRRIGALEKTLPGRGPAIVAKVAEHAGLPEKPSSPDTARNLAFGIFMGLAIGIAAAILRELFDTRVRSGGALSDRFGLVVLGVIEKDSSVKKSPLVIRDAPHSPLAESFRQLRTNLRFVQGQRDDLAVVMTSPQPNEGKSTIVSNLGIALAMAGESVIMVESDFRRPKLGQYLGLGGGPGLSDVLIGQADPWDVLWSWQAGNLKLLLQGTIPPNPSELLGSRAMGDLLTELKTRANVVLIDATPVLAFSDAAVTAGYADTTLLVVRCGHTRLGSVGRAVTALETAGAAVGGVVLNMAPKRGPDSDAAYDGYRGYYGALPHPDLTRQPEQPGTGAAPAGS